MEPRPMTRAAALALTAGGAAAVDDAALREEARRWFEPIPTTPPSLEDNVASPARVALGRQLFFEQQKRGLASFIDTGCATCHGGVNLGGQAYYPFSVMRKPGAEVPPRDDRGRFRVTETATDDGVFSAAPLRNIALTAPYFHSGAVWALGEAVAIMSVAQLGAALDEGQIDDITAFLHGLTGETPEIAHPMPPPRGAGTSLPQPQ